MIDFSRLFPEMCLFAVLFSANNTQNKNIFNEVIMAADAIHAFSNILYREPPSQRNRIHEIPRQIAHDWVARNPIIQRAEQRTPVTENPAVLVFSLATPLVAAP